MKSQALVSIIIPCFNYGHFLFSALESVRTQTLDKWECIVVDDGSTDNTKEIVAGFQGYDSRFKYIYQRNRGMSAARNAGIREARGGYLQFLDADDLLEKRKLELHATFLDAHPEVDVVHGDARYFPSEQPEKRFPAIDGKGTSPIRKLSGEREELLRYLIVDNFMVMSSPMLRARVIAQCGCFDENFRACEDWEFWLRCVNRGMRFGYCEGHDALTLIRFHAGSASKNRSVMLATNLEIRNRLHPSLKEKFLTSLNKNGMANVRIALALEKIHEGNRIEGLKEVFRYSCASGKAWGLLQGLRALVLGR